MQRRGRLDLHGQIGQHGLHQRLIGQARAERTPVPGVVDGLHKRGPLTRG